MIIRDKQYFHVENKKAFQPVAFFKPKTIKKVFDFAYQMSFGQQGEHRKYRSGGQLQRKNGQIFIHTYQGKLAELAIYNVFYQQNLALYQKKLSAPDFSVYGLGRWDDADIRFNNVNISVKSTKFYGDLLLLESKDWNAHGTYIPNRMIYDYIVLVRVKIDGEKLMKRHQCLYANHIKQDDLWQIIHQADWCYDIAGYINHDDLKQLINSKQLIPQNAFLNGTPMDASNYFVETGDLKDFNALVKNLSMT